MQDVPDEAPFALVETTAHGLRLSALDMAARRAGLRTGMALADARAVVPDLATRPAEPDRDHRALSRLARWSGRYGPARGVDGRDGLWIDVTGVAHLYGGESRLLEDLTRRLAGFGITSRCGLADSHGAAFALARHGCRRGEAFVIAPSGETAAAIAGLPVAGLRIDARTVVLLERLGLRRIGDLYPIPREALARRFREAAIEASRPRRARAGTGRRTGSEHHAGSAGPSAGMLCDLLLKRLDQALGREPEPRAPLSEPPETLVRALLAEPLISDAGLVDAVARLAEDLCSSLDRRGVGARRLRLDLYRVDGTCARLVAGTSAPCTDPSHLMRLLRDRLERVDAGFGIDAITLEALSTSRLEIGQSTLTSRLDRGERHSPARLIDQLTARLGADRVLRLQAVSSHIPERAQRRERITDAAHLQPGPGMDTATAGDRPDDQPDEPLAPRLPRPPLLLPSPEPIEVVAEVPEGAPVRFTWRRVAHRVARSEGPERIACEWWRAIAASAGTGYAFPAKRLRPRDYYRLEDDRGAGFWVFREGLYQHEAEDGPPDWFVHGLFG